MRCEWECERVRMTADAGRLIYARGARSVKVAGGRGRGGTRAAGQMGGDGRGRGGAARRLRSAPRRWISSSHVRRVEQSTSAYSASGAVSYANTALAVRWSYSERVQKACVAQEQIFMSAWLSTSARAQSASTERKPAHRHRVTWSAGECEQRREREVRRALRRASPRAHGSACQCQIAAPSHSEPVAVAGRKRRCPSLNVRKEQVRGAESRARRRLPWPMRHKDVCRLKDAQVGRIYDEKAIIGTLLAIPRYCCVEPEKEAPCGRRR